MVLESLMHEGIKEVFGYPGGAVLPLYDAFQHYPLIRHILVRHEQGAGFAAAAVGRVTGKPGVCIATSGPGATNLVTAIADALLDSVPMVCITGQVFSHAIGSDAFQETDILGITMPITKHNYLVERAADIPRIFKEAFHIAASGRPGPVLIDIPKDVFIESDEYHYPDSVDLPGYHPADQFSETEVQHAAELINAAKKPVIIAGHGVWIGNAHAQLEEFVDKSDIPCALTIHGLGSLPKEHPRYLGMLGMHGNAETNFAVHNADLIVAVGIRFDDRITGKLSEFAQGAKVVHLEISPAEVSKNVIVDASLVGDCKKSLPQLSAAIKQGAHDGWQAKIDEVRHDAHEKLATVYPDDRPGDAQPYTYDVIDAIQKYANDEAVIVTDVGQHQMFTCRRYDFKKTFKNITSGGLGSMGFCLPSAIGAKVALPQHDVWSISGDGGFQMNLQELMILVEEHINIKIVIIQNYYLGMVRQWQEIFFKKNYASSPISSPKYKYIAKGYDLPYFSAKRLDEVDAMIRRMHEHEGPCLGEFFVYPEEKVFPMVPAGKNLGDTIVSLDD